MLGIVVERNAGHAVEGSLLGDVARVGDDTLGVSREPAELEVRERVDQADISIQRADSLAGQATKRGDDRHGASRLADSSQQRGQLVLVGNQRLAVKRKDDVAALADIRQRGGSAESPVVEAQRIHQDVAHHEGLRLLRLFARGDARRAHAGGEEIVAEGIDDEPVDLLRHIDIKGTRASDEMSQGNGALLRNDGGGHRGSQIVDHNHHVYRMRIEEGVELGHHAARDLIEARAVDTQIELRTRHLEVGKERGLQRGVILTAGIDHQTLGILALPDGAHQR